MIQTTTSIPSTDTCLAVSCDFCAAPASVLYRARPVTQRIADVLLLSWTRTSWRACAECRSLIASGRRDALVARALAAGPAPNRAGRRALRSSTRRLHDAFWAARTQAEPVPIADALA